MSNLLKTARDFDVALLELQIEVELTFQGWEKEFHGDRLAHRQVLPEPMKPQQPQTAPPQQGY